MKKEELEKLEQALHLDLDFIDNKYIVKKVKIEYLKFLIQNDKILLNIFKGKKRNYPTLTDDEIYNDILIFVNTKINNSVLDFDNEIIQKLLRKIKLERLLTK